MDSRRSSVPGLNARPRTSTRRSGEASECPIDALHEPRRLRPVDAQRRVQDRRSLPARAGKRRERGEVLRQAAPTEPRAGSQVLDDAGPGGSPESAIQVDAFEHLHGIHAVDRFGEPSDLVRKGDAGRQQRVVGRLDQLGGADAGLEPGRFEAVEQRACQRPQTRIIGAHDDAIGPPGIAQHRALAEELREVADRDRAGTASPWRRRAPPRGPAGSCRAARCCGGRCPAIARPLPARARTPINVSTATRSAPRSYCPSGPAGVGTAISTAVAFGQRVGSIRHGPSTTPRGGLQRRRGVRLEEGQLACARAVRRATDPRRRA